MPVRMILWWEEAQQQAIYHKYSAFLVQEIRTCAHWVALKVLEIKKVLYDCDKRSHYYCRIILGYTKDFLDR